MLSYSKWGLSLFPPLNIDEGIADEIVQIMDKSLHTGPISEINRKARLLKEFTISKFYCFLHKLLNYQVSFFREKMNCQV